LLLAPLGCSSWTC